MPNHPFEKFSIAVWMIAAIVLAIALSVFAVRLAYVMFLWEIR